MSDILSTICARGGSKGVPRKNIREIAGVPLIGHAIRDAQVWKRDTDIVVSTDDNTIADVARDYGARVPFIRPDELATDDAPKLPVIKHALKQMEATESKTYDYIVDIGATTPLREPVDIEQCFATVTDDPKCHNAYTVRESERNPYFNMVEVDEDGYARLSKSPEENFVRRQDTPMVYGMNAAVYVYERDFLLETDSTHGKYTRISVMPPERSVDIDSELDLKFANFLSTQSGDLDV